MRQKWMSLLVAAVLFAALATHAAAAEAETDVVVVGGGGAGLIAAVEAADQGAEVIVLEKLPFVGGETLISGGAFQAAGTELQEEAGIEDAGEDLFKYWMKASYFQSDPELVRAVALNSAANVEWLQEQGMELSDDVTQGAWTDEVAQRVHRAEGGGSEFIGALEEAAVEAGVEIYTETKGVELIEENGAIVGVKAEGQLQEVRARSVIVATGGFGDNEDLIAEYAPHFADTVPVTTPGNTGTGLLMAKDKGAATADVFSAIGYRTVEDYAWDSPVAGLAMQPILFVNEQGRRFVDESAHYALIAEALGKQGGFAYQIFDSSFLADLPEETQDAVADAIADGDIHEADSLETLAEDLGIPEDNLKATLDEFNEYAAEGTGPKFFRNPDTIRELDTAPYYAVPVQQAHLGTIGGLKINTEGQVLTDEGTAIPGLYAAGSVTGDFLGQVYPAGGSAIAMVIETGRTAGRTAANE